MVYLASKSPRRRSLLKKMRVRFRVVSSRYREEKLRGVRPKNVALRHAIGKVQGAIVPSCARFILGADTIVCCRGRILGKPGTRKEALRMLGLLSGRVHDVCTGVALLDRREGKIWAEVSKTGVYIERLSRERMLQYIGKVNPFDKAGAYAIQERPKIVSRIRGSYSNVIGLPVEVVGQMLKRLGGKKKSSRFEKAARRRRDFRV